MKKIYIINGPNINKLGIREPKKYGSQSFKDLKLLCKKLCEEKGYKFDFFQSNNEGDIVDKIQEACSDGNSILINAAAYTHTSIAISDALAMFDGPIVEIHITNIHARESFRHHSFISKLAKGIIVGFGLNSYKLGIEAIDEIFKSKRG